MRTNIEIDDALMKKAMKASQLEMKTKKAVVEEALQLLVKSRAQAEGLRRLFGKGEFWDGYDYKAMRGGDSAEDLPRVTSKTALRRLEAKRSSRSKAA